MGHGGLRGTQSNLQYLAIEHAKTRGALIGFMQRGFWSRLRWLVFGEPRPKRQPINAE